MVGMTAGAARPVLADHPLAKPAANRPVGLWLFLCAGMVFAMAIIGAITRLTESGLSMVEWRPLIGWLPPLSEAEWARVFGLYQESPEFRLLNSSMDLAAFKQIFFWEWLHRVWGRLIGLAFAIPMVIFALRRQIPGDLWPWVLAAFALGAGQGLWGWYMVQSGLVDQPAVSQYRLAGHLGLAFIIFALLLWMGCRAYRIPRAGLRMSRSPASGLLASVILLAATIIWGAMVAGLDAGLAYNTFPLMDGAFFPAAGLSIVPWWANLFENTALVQFIHRWLAIGTLVVILWSGHSVVRSAPGLTNKRLGLGLMAMACLQVGLGIATLLSFVALPLAALHQAGAFVLVGLLTLILYRLLGAPELRAEQD